MDSQQLHVPSSAMPTAMPPPPPPPSSQQQQQQQQSSLYIPTPIEEAYAYFIMETVFQIPFQTDEIRVPGRLAVPFLTNAVGVDRSLLRDIWSLADPQAEGFLSTNSQLSIILRCISMAQANLLDPPEVEEGMVAVPPDLTMMLQQHQSSTWLPLATFQTVTIPPQEQLMATYGSIIKMNTTATTTMETAPLQVEDVTSAFDALVGEVADQPLVDLTTSTNEKWITEIASKSTKLPLEELQLKETGEIVDYALVLKHNILQLAPKDEQQVLLDRCQRVHDELYAFGVHENNEGDDTTTTTTTTTTTQQQPLYWKPIFNIAKEELRQALSLLEEAFLELPKNDERLSQSLSTMVACVGENVRIVRSIVATIGDILALPLETTLYGGEETTTTSTTIWCHLPLIKQAQDIEHLWNSIVEEATSFNLGTTIPLLESIEDIRRVSATTAAGLPLCQITLRPLIMLETERSTKSSVTFPSETHNKDMECMACAANFVSHKVLQPQTLTTTTS